MNGNTAKHTANVGKVAGGSAGTVAILWVLFQAGVLGSGSHEVAEALEPRVMALEYEVDTKANDIDLRELTIITNNLVKEAEIGRGRQDELIDVIRELVDQRNGP